jgi:dUTP pyrophosphatase
MGLSNQIENLSEKDLEALIELLNTQLKRKRRRGFEIAGGFEDKVLHMPRRATPGSGGYDFYPLESITLQPGASHAFKTGIKAYMPEDEILLINIRSSYGIKHNIQLCNEQGWIDSDYYGNPDNDGLIIIKVKNAGTRPFQFKQDEPFAQGMFIRYHIADNDNPRLSNRRGGIGHSSGRK